MAPKDGKDLLLILYDDFVITNTTRVGDKSAFPVVFPHKHPTTRFLASKLWVFMSRYCGGGLRLRFEGLFAIMFNNVTIRVCVGKEENQGDANVGFVGRLFSCTSLLVMCDFLWKHPLACTER